MKMDQMTTGSYIIVFQVDWFMVSHNERKLIVNTYAPTELEIKSIKNQQFDESFINVCSYWIEARDFE